MIERERAGKLYSCELSHCSRGRPRWADGYRQNSEGEEKIRPAVSVSGPTFRSDRRLVVLQYGFYHDRFTSNFFLRYCEVTMKRLKILPQFSPFETGELIAHVKASVVYLPRLISLSAREVYPTLPALLTPVYRGRRADRLSCYLLLFCAFPRTFPLTVPT